MGWTLRSARYLAQEAVAGVLQPGDTAVDCTLGNGHDALFLAECVGPMGRLIGFDIQREAVERAQARLATLPQQPEITLYARSHSELGELVREPVRCVMFNLGWLPGGDKTITTRWESTETAVRAALGLLLPMGVCTICAYPGHPEGDRERQALTGLLASLRPQEYNVLHQRFLNAGTGAPECFVIQRQG